MLSNRARARKHVAARDVRLGRVRDDIPLRRRANARPRDVDARPARAHAAHAPRVGDRNVASPRRLRPDVRVREANGEHQKKPAVVFFFGRTTRAERARACNFDERSTKEALQVIEANYGRTERLVPPPPRRVRQRSRVGRHRRRRRLVVAKRTPRHGFARARLRARRTHALDPVPEEARARLWKGARQGGRLRRCDADVLGGPRGAERAAIRRRRRAIRDGGCLLFRQASRAPELDVPARRLRHDALAAKARRERRRAAPRRRAGGARARGRTRPRRPKLRWCSRPWARRR